MKEAVKLKATNSKQRNYTPLIWVLSIVIIAVILATNYLPRSTNGTIAGVDLTVLPLLNAVFNGITFCLLVGALIMIKKKNIKAHRNFILGAFGMTMLFFVTYLTYHAMAGSTSFGGDGFLKGIYYFVLVSHIILAAAIVPMSLITLGRGLNMKVEKHRKIARWTMPIWLYVAFTGVLVYVLISPYY
ncbi:uncharacterized protein JNUCC1_00604 [Lentibacillus sp. JNUCC-1]|uniref:DUF420 domain-containing protein n=1 Tax=Lentibacillus sp. JNUCC-1 TaxID=2654513 RepID=UPI0012E723BF|nr:DUF420 domain-containing protein [Lentibacillus sp. JNUCC-1]MUV36800.1 uncharacterized protein [Lentibacillus sp. JNUCC-1]